MIEYENKKLIGIKYCGGCNPKYDRGRYVDNLKIAMPDSCFEYAKEDSCYDVLYVVCGCDRRCASYKQYKAKSFIFVSDTGEYV